MRTITTIGFDGDDTLWHNESIFTLTQEKFRRLLQDYIPAEELEQRLIATEGRNLHVFGYGVKGFTLSMIETAIEVSGEAVPASTIRTIIEYGKEMLAHPVEMLGGVERTIKLLSRHYRLILITKGDLFDQESKIARSGLAELFERVEIVSEKDEATYRRILSQQAVDPGEFLMVGNSVRSDILPVLAIGARAVHVPYHTTWAHERAELGEDLTGVWRLERLSQLPGLLDRIQVAA
jgi:putative hydrolase of the HAD superfamily